VLENIRIVLSNTSHPGNIGAAARAMKTMELSRLYLVNPKRYPDAEATALEEVEAEAGSGATPKYLRVLVNSKDGDEVNIRVPLKLIRTGIKLSTMLPSETNAKLADKGIDLSELGKLEGEDLVQALRELTVNVDSADGDTVRIFCE